MALSEHLRSRAPIFAPPAVRKAKINKNTGFKPQTKIACGWHRFNQAIL